MLGLLGDEWTLLLLQQTLQGVTRYGELKRRLAGEHDDMVEYTRAKTALVREGLLSVGYTPRTGWAAE